MEYHNVLFDQEGKFQCNNSEDSPKNDFLNLMVISIVFLVTAAVDFLLKLVFSLWIPFKASDLVDLMSVGNISIIIFEDILHGYYVHGKAVSGVADVNSETLKKILDGESVGETRKRGLNQNDETELQTFEIYVPATIRANYNEQLSGVVDRAEIERGISLERRDERQYTEYLEMELKEKKKERVGEYLRAYISRIESDCGSIISEKSCWDYFFQMPPGGLCPPGELPQEVFLKDPRLGFADLAGIDFHIVFLRVLLFFFWERVVGHTYFSLIFTYFIEQIIWWIRGILITNNIANTTLIDDRFLSQNLHSQLCC